MWMRLRSRSGAGQLLVAVAAVAFAVAGACGTEPDAVLPPITRDGGGDIDAEGLIARGDAGADLKADKDQDGVPDLLEGPGDDDGDGVPNVDDPINDGVPPAIKLVPITTNFNSPIGIDYHEPTNSVILSVNYTTGLPVGFERIEFDGTHHAFSMLNGLTDEVKIATARSGNPAGFAVGDLFVGNGVDGQIVRISGDGNTVVNPWVDLPGDNNGLMRGSLYVDRTGVFGGDLVVVTTNGEVWRVTVAGAPTKVAAVPGVHLEGVAVVPNLPARFGPLAGKLIAGAEAEHVMYAFATDGTFEKYTLGVDIEDVDINTGRENFFGVDFGGSRLLGADPTQWAGMIGDVIVTQEEVVPGTSGLFRLHWDRTEVTAQPIPLTMDSATVGHWEHVTFAAAGIAEIAPVR
jgi:hypothetical protein